MKKLLPALLIAICSIAGIVYASSVTTTDGKIFNVTNDTGYTAVMTNAQIMAQVESYNSQYIVDSQRVLTEQETMYVWQGVEAMAVNAAIPFPQTNSVNAVINASN